MIIILETCDGAGVTLAGVTVAGYNAIYNRVKFGMQSTIKGLRKGCLPNPHQVVTLRSELNLHLTDSLESTTQ